ncbi:MAG TPA: sugar kinase [Vicinamibacterales bacterium]|nr:sugar kinase [Vicinamibacterales bacterium]
MAKTVCFGEIMLRLSPPGFERLFQTPALHATFGGGEANVAVSLAQFGHDSHYVTRLPNNPIGDAAIKALRAERVQVDHVQRGGERVGIYFAETGASQRGSSVVYDRAHSAISEMEPGSMNWTAVMAGARWFHCTGITPALGGKAAACTKDALDAAKQAGATISIDLNYRSKLWSQAEAQRVMRPLVALADVVIANEEDLQSVLGIPVEHADVIGGALNVDGYRDAAGRVAREFNVRRVAVTLRESTSASENGWSAVLFDAATSTFLQSQRYTVRVVDRIGGGDSFAAGLIHGFVSGRDLEATLKFAVAASALKQTIPGDFNQVSVSEVERLVAGDASGRVQR